MSPQHQIQNEAAASAPTQANKPDRFTALLIDVQRGLGRQWTFYEECIEGILEAAAQDKDTTAWFEQMQRLVDGNNQVRFGHEGVLFLLRDMGVRPSKQQSQIGGEGHGSKYLSLPLSPPQANFIGSAPPSTAERNSSHVSFNSMSGQPPNSRRGQSTISEQGQLPISVQGQLTMSVQGQLPMTVQGQSSMSEQSQSTISEDGHLPIPEQGQTSISEQSQASNSRQGQTFSSRQGQTNLPVLAQWPVTYAPTLNTRLQQKQVLKLRTKGLPFDFSALSILPELTYPRDLQGFFYPSDDIVLDPDRWVPRVYPFKPHTGKTVLFEDPTMKVKVDQMFGYSAGCEAGIPNGPDDQYFREINHLPYDPEEDDLAAWAAKLEGSTEGGEDQMKASDHITQWPLWKKRYEMEL